MIIKYSQRSFFKKSSKLRLLYYHKRKKKHNKNFKMFQRVEKNYYVPKS